MNDTWDFVVVGTGMGGGPIGLRLAQAGFSVLFIEKGLSPEAADSIKGQFAESHSKSLPTSDVLRRAGRSTSQIFDITKGAEKKLFPFLGSGVGGSSALYGMVLERFKPIDFRNWPLSYKSFTNYYDQAERLFKVRKERPIRHAGIQKLNSFLISSGLKPYTLPLANEENPSCGECQSMLCACNCKNDSNKICIAPALQNHGASLLTECEALKIEVSNRSVSGIHVLHKGRSRLILAKNVILAAGALCSPVLLQSSISKEFPNGIGNNFDLVGRHLMRHYVDLFALKIDSEPQNKKVKEIGLNEFYDDGNETIGTVQSFGRLPPVHVIVGQLEKQIASNHSLIVSTLFRLIKPLLTLVLKQLCKGRLVMASIIADTPVYENRVWLKDGKVVLRYQISKVDQRKIHNLRVQLKTLFKPLNLWFIPSAEKNEMLAHVCGTCRMGHDANTSVVDLENRVHGVKNLYVVDSSFFPSAGGTNPGLTIAANALRVAEILIMKNQRRFKASMPMGARSN